MVTITTLGYGEITPIGNVGMLLTSMESLLGIVIFGFFINSMWRKFGLKLEESQQDKLDQAFKDRSKRRMANYFSYFKVVLDEHEKVVTELTTPLKLRNDIRHYNANFNFSDLGDIYYSSMSLKYSLEAPIIKIYFDKEREIFDELKYILSNFDLSEYRELNSDIIEYLRLTKKNDFESILLFYNQPGSKDEKIRSILEGIIRENKTCPSINDSSTPNTLYPVIKLYHSIKGKMELLKNIRTRMQEIE